MVHRGLKPISALLPVGGEQLLLECRLSLTKLVCLCCRAMMMMMMKSGAMLWTPAGLWTCGCVPPSQLQRQGQPTSRVRVHSAASERSAAVIVIISRTRFPSCHEIVAHTIRLKAPSEPINVKILFSADVSTWCFEGLWRTNAI